MAVQFLTPEYVARSGDYAGETSIKQLVRNFHLDGYVRLLWKLLSATVGNIASRARQPGLQLLIEEAMVWQQDYLGWQIFNGR